MILLRESKGKSSSGGVASQGVGWITGCHQKPPLRPYHFSFLPLTHKIIAPLLIFLQRHAFLQIAFVELLFLEICGYPFLLRDPHISNGTIYAQLGNLLVGRRMTKN